MAHQMPRARKGGEWEKNSSSAMVDVVHNLIGSSRDEQKHNYVIKNSLAYSARITRFSKEERTERGKLRPGKKTITNA